MGSMNRATLIGNLGRDAELRYTPGGAAVATFSIATSERWKGKDGTQQEKTEWHRCVLWGKAAEALSEYLTKGKQVAVEGRIETRKWTDKDGNDKYSTEIRVDRVILLGGSGNGSSSSSAPRAQQRGNTGQSRATEPEPGSDFESGGFLSDDDIPF